MNFFNVHISPESKQLVTKVLDDGYISEGDVVKDFEVALAEELGLRNPVTTNSGTAALHLALALAGVDCGDEVILPAQTFIATGLAILMTGATPVFADIDPMTGNISPESIEENVTKYTKAIIAVHWGGYPCDMREIADVAIKHNLIIIEDAAHALGATYRRIPIGSTSDFACFSFQAIKHLTTGDGGALCCFGDGNAWKARKRRWFGISRDESPASLLGERVYNTDVLSYKYHMNNIAAAIGLGNLTDFKSRLARRQEIGAYYRAELENTPGVCLLDSKPDRTHAYWLFTMMVEKREDFIRRMKWYGIPTSVVHQRIDRNSVFGEAKFLPGQEIFDASQISIPVHDGLSDEDIENVVGAIRGGW